MTIIDHFHKGLMKNQNKGVLNRNSRFLVKEIFSKEVWNHHASGRNLPANAGDTGLIPGLGRSPGGRAWQLHSSILAWRISCREEPGGLQCIRPQRVDWSNLALALVLAYAKRRGIPTGAEDSGYVC